MSNFGPSPESDTRTLSSVQGDQVNPKTGEIVARAFVSEDDLSNFVSTLITNNAQRNTQNSRITAKLAAERPWDPEELKQAGLAWKSNFTTRPLNTLVSKVEARFPRAIASARYLTSASLPPTAENADEKSNYFRQELTDFLRGFSGWVDLIESLSHENVLFGWTVGAALDEDDILPRPFRQDQVFVPTGTRQRVEGFSQIVFRVDKTPHEAYEMLVSANAAAEDPELSDQRWDRQRLAEAINNALPDNVRAKSSAGESARSLVDLQRQLSSIGTAGGQRKVVFYHVLAVELTGKVSHYILDSERKQLFSQLDRWDSMAEVVHPFAMEYGDGTLHSSKGVGRTAYAFAAVMDRARNDVVDRLQLSGKIIVKVPDNNRERFKMAVVGNMIQLNQDATVEKVTIDSNVESSIQVDAYLRGLLDEMTGSVSPRAFEGRDRVTNAEVNLLTSREGERVDDVLSRWLQQAGDMVTAVQRRIARSESPAAMTFKAKLAERLTPEEIEYLLAQPALRVVEDLSERERADILVASTEQAGNPLVDQHKLLFEKLSAQVSPAFAKRVVLPANDPTVQSEQVRLQRLEIISLSQGIPIPVSPRDNHVVHLTELMQPMAATSNAVLQDPSQEATAMAMIQHVKEHAAMLGKAQVPPEVQALISATEQLEKALVEAKVQADAPAAAPQSGPPVV